MSGARQGRACRVSKHLMWSLALAVRKVSIACRVHHSPVDLPAAEMSQVRVLLLHSAALLVGLQFNICGSAPVQNSLDFPAVAKPPPVLQNGGSTVPASLSVPVQGSTYNGTLILDLPNDVSKMLLPNNTNSQGSTKIRLNIADHILYFIGYGNRTENQSHALRLNCQRTESESPTENNIQRIPPKSVALEHSGECMASDFLKGTSQGIEVPLPVTLTEEAKPSRSNSTSKRMAEGVYDNRITIQEPSSVLNPTKNSLVNGSVNQIGNAEINIENSIASPEKLNKKIAKDVNKVKNETIIDTVDKNTTSQSFIIPTVNSTVNFIRITNNEKELDEKLSTLAKNLNVNNIEIDVKSVNTEEQLENDKKFQDFLRQTKLNKTMPSYSSYARNYVDHLLNIAEFLLRDPATASKTFPILSTESPELAQVETTQVTDPKLQEVKVIDRPGTGNELQEEKTRQVIELSTTASPTTAAPTSVAPTTAAPTTAAPTTVGLITPTPDIQLVATLSPTPETAPETMKPKIELQALEIQKPKNKTPETIKPETHLKSPEHLKPEIKPEMSETVTPELKPKTPTTLKPETNIKSPLTLTPEITLETQGQPPETLKTEIKLKTPEPLESETNFRKVTLIIQPGTTVAPPTEPTTTPAATSAVPEVLPTTETLIITEILPEPALERQEKMSPPIIKKTPSVDPTKCPESNNIIQPEIPCFNMINNYPEPEIPEPITVQPTKPIPEETLPSVDHITPQGYGVNTVQSSQGSVQELDKCSEMTLTDPLAAASEVSTARVMENSTYDMLLSVETDDGNYTNPDKVQTPRQTFNISENEIPAPPELASIQVDNRGATSVSFDNVKPEMVSVETFPSTKKGKKTYKLTVNLPQDEYAFRIKNTDVKVATDHKIYISFDVDEIRNSTQTHHAHP